MSENNAVLKKGTQIKIFGCPFVVLEDVRLDASQEFLAKVLQDQDDFNSGVGTELDSTDDDH